MDIMSILKAAGIGGGLASAGGGIASLFGHNKNPADTAMRELSGVPGQVNPYYQPYIDRGRKAGDLYNQQSQDLVNNPNAIYDKLASGYKESPGYKYALQKALGAGDNAVAAGGMLGTPMHQEQEMDIASGIASKDFENYIMHQLGLFGAGMSGLEGEDKMGFGASTGYGDILGSLANAKADYAYTGEAGKNEKNQAGWQNIISGLATAAPYLFL